MKKPMRTFIAMALAAMLILPTVAFAQGPPKSGERDRDSGPGVTRDRDSATAERDSAKAERTQRHQAQKTARKAQLDADKTARKELRTAEKAARVTERRAEKAAREAGRPDDADEPTRSADPTRSIDATRSVGPGVNNAFARITRNLERSLAKMADGSKKQLPPGLVRTWLKFAAWLDVDASTIPGSPGPIPTSTVEPTGTPTPTSTVEPTGTPSP